MHMMRGLENEAFEAEAEQEACLLHPAVKEAVRSLDCTGLSPMLGPAATLLISELPDVFLS